MCRPWALARLLPSAVRVRIKSRSTSARRPSTAITKRPVLVPVSAHGSASDRNCAFASTMRLTMPNRSKVERASRSIRVTVTTSPGAEAVEHAEKLAPVGPRAGHLLAVDVPAGASGGAKLVKLRVEDLPVGADASVADEAFFRVSFSHILCRHNPLAGLWQANLAKILTYAEESKESTDW